MTLDAVLVVDTTKGNRIINHRGFAISPTVKEGYILRVSEDLLDVMISTTGRLPHVFALSQQDITPYGNGLYHLNSILQPATATKAPVVGVAVTTETTVAGCAHRSYPSGGPGGCRTVYAGGSQGLWKWSVLLLR